MMKILTPLLIYCLCISSAYAERKALVIGNADYSIRPLKNPLNDARDMTEKLGSLGFSVTTKKNLNRQAMRDSIRDFSKTLHTGDEALFYFSGHGAQIARQNYLIPLGNDIQDEDEVSDEAVPLSFVLNKFTNAPSKLNIIILDACRDNPFKSRFKSATRGLARLEQGIKGPIVAFAASSGGVSEDGNNTNGTYTQYLLHHLANPNITLNQMFNRVRADVNKATNGHQLPIEENGLLSDVYLLKQQQPEPIDTKPVPKITQPQIIPTLKPADSQAVSQKTRQAFEPEMVFIKGGTFKMGCVSGEGCRDDETVHSVSVNDFWIGKYEVTFDEWQACVDKAGCQSNKNPDDKGWGRGKHPVINVNWHDVNEYAAWLSKNTGKNYRLPTEAEWEYAARAGSQTKYPWGNKINCFQAAYGYTECNARGTSQVGSYRPNQWGLYNTVGNVWEWTCSAYPKIGDYNGLETQCANSNDSRSHVLRGGSWGIEPRDVRSATRGWIAASKRSGYVGFRLSRTR